MRSLLWPFRVTVAVLAALATFSLGTLSVRFARAGTSEKTHDRVERNDVRGEGRVDSKSARAARAEAIAALRPVAREVFRSVRAVDDRAAREDKKLTEDPPKWAERPCASCLSYLAPPDLIPLARATHPELDWVEAEGARNLRVRRVEVDRTLDGKQQNIVHEILELSADHEIRTPADLEAAERLAKKVVISVERRNEVVKRLGGKVEATLEPKQATKKDGSPVGQSPLAAYLKRNKVSHAQSVAESFDQNSLVQVVTLREEMTLLRLFTDGSGVSLPVGRYYFCCLENLFEDEIWADGSKLATPSVNLHSDLALVKVPAGTKVLVGIVENDFGQPGGNVQVLVPKVKKFPFEKYRLVSSSHETSAIKVVDDDGRVLQFQRDAVVPGPEARKANMKSPAVTHTALP